MTSTVGVPISNGSWCLSKLMKHPGALQPEQCKVASFSSVCVRRSVPWIQIPLPPLCMKALFSSSTPPTFSKKRSDLESHKTYYYTCIHVVVARDSRFLPSSFIWIWIECIVCGQTCDWWRLCVTIPFFGFPSRTSSPFGHRGVSCRSKPSNLINAFRACCSPMSACSERAFHQWSTWLRLGLVEFIKNIGPHGQQGICLLQLPPWLCAAAI